MYVELSVRTLGIIGKMDQPSLRKVAPAPASAVTDFRGKHAFPGRNFVYNNYTVSRQRFFGADLLSLNVSMHVNK